MTPWWNDLFYWTGVFWWCGATGLVTLGAIVAALDWAVRQLATTETIFRILRQLRKERSENG
jgi:hypothetical protein